jgi:hypothetical protein
MKTARSHVAVLATLALVGCDSPLFRPDDATEVAGLLASYRRTASATAEEQRHELALAQAAYEKTPNDSTRLAFALAMMQPQSASRDDARLTTLLAAVSAGSGDRASPRYDLAQTLLGLIQREQRRQEQTARQLRDERRHNDEMQQKIESLRAIDRDIRSRRSSQ